MRAIIQRCSYAKCVVEGTVTGEIQNGFLVLVGFTHSDTIANIEKMAKKIVNLRIFEDENEKMNRSILDVSGSILSISQFTLYANPYTGNRPSFTDSMNPTDASRMYDLFNEELKKYNLSVETGIFQAHMEISLCNSGPVTISLEL